MANSAAEKAHDAAVKEIRRVKQAGETTLDLRDKRYRALDRIPQDIATLSALKTLRLDQTAVSDLAPLAALTALEELTLNQTAVSDLAPLAALTALQRLWLNQTAVRDLAPLAGLAELEDLVLDGCQVADLRPIRSLAKLGTNFPPGLSFRDTPATRADGTLARLAGIEDTEDRARETLAYLNTLPPWPEPYTPLSRPDGEPPQPVGQAEPLLTVEALIQAQDLAGWRFSPSHGALSLFIRDQPMDQRQDQLARMAADRCARLLAKLGQRTNSGGMRQDIREEAGEFAALLAETGRSMAERSLELWGSLIALGELLDANDRARREGRDPLDLLPDEARAALSTFLATAASLVRSFPEARALDDDHGGFARRVATRQMMDDILQEAVRAALVSQPSANLIIRVAEVADGQGKQAEKASAVSIKGLRNLVFVSTMLGSAFGAVAGGVLEDIGGDISDTFELGEKASAFLSGLGDRLEEFLGALPPDEAALLRAKLQEHQDARRDRP